MKKLAISLFTIIPIALIGWTCYLIASAPLQPNWDWDKHMSVVDHDALVAILNRSFRVAAYAITWAIQLGYLAWLGLKWRAQKRDARRTGRNLR